MKCAFCGHRFSVEEAQVSCRGCPMAAGCRMVKCPNCGYEAIPESGMVKAIRGWWRRRNAA